MSRFVSRSLPFLALVSCFLAMPTAFSQERSIDLGVKVVNPYALGLDNVAAATPSGPPGSFSIGGGAGMKEIRIEITSKSTQVKSAREVKEFIEENGISFDSNAASFVYYLNPDLPSVPKLPSNTTLQLPVLRIPSMEDERNLPKHPVIAVVVEPKLKERLRQDIDEFESKVMKKEKKFEPDIRSDLDSIDGDLNQVYWDKVPSSREMLEQVRQYVAALETIFSGRPKGRFLSSEESKEIKLIKSDLREKIVAARQGNPDVSVTVKTLKDQVEISGFIVCFAPEALYKANQCDLSFSGKSSPTDQPLAAATYMFWAIKPGETISASDVRRIPVWWQGSEFKPIDLTIK